MLKTTLAAGTAALFALIALGGVIGGASAQMTFDPPLAKRPMGAATAPPVTSDEQFVTVAAGANQAEIAEARLALKLSQSARVRAFAQRMIDDHTTAAVGLRAATNGTGMSSPAMVPTSARMEIDRLAKLSGSEFDARYMLDAVPDHQNAVAAFTWEANSGKNDALRAYAQKTLPVVAQHLRLAQTFVASNGMTLGVGPADAGAVINPPGRGSNAMSTTGPANNPATTTNGTTQGGNSATNTMPTPQAVGPSGHP